MLYSFDQISTLRWSISRISDAKSAIFLLFVWVFPFFQGERKSLYTICTEDRASLKVIS